MEIDKKIVSKNIYLIRTSLHLSQRQFAKKMGYVSNGLICQWEKGYKIPRTEQLIEIAKLGNVSVQDLLCSKLVCDSFYGSNSNIDKKIVGLNIWLIRASLRMNQRQFGKKIGNFSKTLVCYWEKGHTLPRNKELIEIAKLGNISVQDLLYSKIQTLFDNDCDNNIDQKIVGQNISLIRRTSGLTLEEFEEKVNNTREGTAEEWENGESILSNKQLAVISQLGNIDTVDSLYDKDFEFYEPIKLLFNACLEKHTEYSFIGKALRFFEEKERNEILKLVVKSTLLSSAYVYKDKKEVWGNVEKPNYENIFYQKMITMFQDEYANRIKTNRNIIGKCQGSIKELCDYIEAYNYKECNSFLEFNINNSDKANICYYEKGVSTELLRNINSILCETKEKINDLFLKYDGKASEKGIDISIIKNYANADKAKSYEIASIVDGKSVPVVAEVFIDDRIKEIITEIAKTNDYFLNNSSQINMSEPNL